MPRAALEQRAEPMLSTPATFVALHAPRRDPRRATFVFRGDELLAEPAGFGLPDEAQSDAIGVPPGQTWPVGLLDGRYCAAAWVDPGFEQPPGWEFVKLRRLLGTVDDAWFAVAGRAFQVAEFARTHRFCGHCATPMQGLDGERCFRCPACGHSAYPRISPAMMVLIRDGERLLLARHNRLASRFTALAGFLEAGESVEEAVHREVYEEVGLKVRDLRYFGSQSWPFPHSLMLAFTAEYAGGEIRIDAEEITEARWFGPADEKPDIPPGQSIASALIQANLPAAWRTAAEDPSTTRANPR